MIVLWGRLFYSFIIFVSIMLSFLQQEGECQATAFDGHGFARTSGTHFEVNGRPLYLNGFNAYWLMYMASDPSTRDKVTTIFQQASGFGMNVARTWAFSDGGYRPLQYYPGSYNKDMFKGLDFVISEASKNGVYMILSLVNNYENYGGRKQYVQWAREKGQYLNNDDEFYTNSVVKGYYKNHIKVLVLHRGHVIERSKGIMLFCGNCGAQAVLTRINTISGVAYKDDPTIFAWELMNEPRCQTDLSGRALQDWIGEMAAYVKSIDINHLLEIGLEGFYGETMPEKKQFNPAYEVGTDFISNNRLPGIDFATIHLYPDQWMPGSTDQTQATFAEKWIQAHIEDSNSILRKPLLVTEFGKSSRSPGYTLDERNGYFGNLYSTIYTSARSGGPCVGGLFWQLMAEGMDNFRDGYEVVLAESPSTASVIAQQSRLLSTLS